MELWIEKRYTGKRWFFVFSMYFSYGIIVGFFVEFGFRNICIL